jgi:hypothetical protein
MKTIILFAFVLFCTLRTSKTSRKRAKQESEGGKTKERKEQRKHSAKLGADLVTMLHSSSTLQ